MHLRGGSLALSPRNSSRALPSGLAHSLPLTMPSWIRLRAAPAMLGPATNMLPTSRPYVSHVPEHAMPAAVMISGTAFGSIDLSARRSASMGKKYMQLRRRKGGLLVRGRASLTGLVASCRRPTLTHHVVASASPSHTLLSRAHELAHPSLTRAGHELAHPSLTRAGASSSHTKASSLTHTLAPTAQ